MAWQSVTALVIVALVVGGIVYDLVAFALGGNDATISATCLRVAAARPCFALSVAFALGVFVGHLFLPQHPPR